MRTGYIVVFSIIALLFLLPRSHAMGGTQFGTYSQAYLDRQRYLVFASHFGNGQVWFNKADAIKLPVQKCELEARKYRGEVTASCYREEEFRALP
jgi:hypothetical protein